MPWIGHIPRPEARAALLSVVLGVSLLAVKFFAYYLTLSAAIFSDALESIVNVLASGVALYALMLAHRPADAEHPYGHGKVEFLSAWFEGGMILMAAVAILVRTSDALVRGQYLVEEHVDVGLVLMVLAMLVNGGLGLYLLGIGRRQRSMTLEADGWHLLSDAWTSIAVLVALAVVKLSGWRAADPAMAIAIAFYLMYMASRILRAASAGLMDKQDRHEEWRIRQILDSHLEPEGRTPQICSYHKLRHRHSGRYLWVDFHISVPAHLSVLQGHEIASAIEYEIEQTMGEGNATAHVEPCARVDCTARPGAAAWSHAKPGPEAPARAPATAQEAKSEPQRRG
jgi:cation diffusion facilitator family transporter